jgi:WD40 repeat protein
LFISHSGQDNVQALAFQNWLANNGWTREDVFIDLHGIGAGERWRDTLRKANHQCEAVILLASPASLDSKECQREMNLAEDQGKEIIVALLRDLSKDDPRLARYSERQFVDLSLFPQDHIEALEFGGRSHRVAFNPGELAKIKARLDDLGIAPGSFAWPPKERPNAEPYPGLSAFTEDDAGIFFGRDADIMSALTEIRMARRRRSPRVIVIDAASGAGKSSFLRAGLWPRLRRDPDFAPLAILRPAQGILTGPDGLARRIAPYFEQFGKIKTPGSILASLARAETTEAVDVLRVLIFEATELAAAPRRAASPDARAPATLIAIDQGEELFSAENEAESRQFLELLASVLRAPLENVDIYLLVTIRADSVQSLLNCVAELGLETPKALYLPPLSPAAYRDVILKPAEIYSERVRRLSIEPALVSALIDDATGADALPLLAFTLAQLFANFAAAGQISLAQYRETGGASGSIKRALQQALARAGAAGTHDNLRRLIIPRLATWDPDADQGKGAAKRLVARMDDVIGADRTSLAPLVNALVAKRLLTQTRDTIEVAHEALLRQPPIGDWLEENREFLIWRDRLARERASYESNQRGLLVGRELQIARDWLRIRAEDDIATADRKFVLDSSAEEDRRRTDEEERERQRQASELTAARRLARRTTGGLVVALVLAAIAGGAGVYAYSQQRAAIAQAAAAESATREAQLTQSRFLSPFAARNVEDGDAATGLLIALEAMPDGNSSDVSVKKRPVWGPAVESLDAALRNMHELILLAGHSGSVDAVAVSPDGTRIVTASRDKTARVWEAATGKEIARLEGHGDYVTSAAWSPDGTRIVTGSSDKTVRVWDAKTFAEIAILKGHTDFVTSVAVSPDGTRIVTGSFDKTARVWDAKTGDALAVLIGHAGWVGSVVVSPDGAHIVTGSHDGTAQVWDAKTGAELAALKGHTGNVTSVAVTPDGTRIVTGSEDKTARVWDAKTFAELVILEGHTKEVHCVAVSPDGTRIVTGSSDKTVRVWDIKTGAELLTLNSHTEYVSSVAITPDGSRLVTGSGDRTARIWNAKLGPEIAVLDVGSGNQKEYGFGFGGVAFNPDGSHIVTISHDKTARVYNLDAFSVFYRIKLGQFDSNPGLISKAAFVPVRGAEPGATTDGVRLFLKGLKTTQILDATNGTILAELETGLVTSVTMIPDDIHLVTIPIPLIPAELRAT